MESRAFISLCSISKTYGKNNKVLSNFNLDIEEGLFLSILGSSGSGKSTILNLIAGFSKPDQGKILLNGIDIKDIPPHQRPTATVFQDYALFPHMNVWDNIAYGLKKMTIDRDDVSQDTYFLINKLHNKSIDKSNKKLERLNVKIRRLMKNILLLYKSLKNTKIKSGLWYRFKKFYLRNLILKINDLDYWKSYWQFFPILIKKKLFQKYIQRPLNKEEIRTRVKEIIQLIGLSEKSLSMKDTLSGGAQQRVALARAIITQPKILLLDEPLSALDENLREKLQLELKRLHRQLKITFILVTHSQKEALVLSDKIVVLKKGRIEQIGTPQELYDSPINSWVAKFMGKANIFRGVYLSPGEILVWNKKIITNVTEGFDKYERVHIMMRPEDYDTVKKGDGIIDVLVVDAIYKGQFWELKCKFLDEIIYVENIDFVNIGKEIGLIWDSIDVHVMKIQNH